MKLGKIIAEEIINDGKEVIGVYGGSFKPVTAGHFEVLKQSINKHPNINKFIVYVGSGTRDNVSQAESILIWELYKKYLNSNVEIIPVSSPIKSIYDLSKNNPNKNIKWFLGSREDKEQDLIDFSKRTTHSHKYPNLEVINIITPSSQISMSGTDARRALKKSKEEFLNYIPQELSPDDKDEVYNILSKKITENKQREATFFGRLGLKWDKFLEALTNEKNETKEAFDLLLSSYRGDIKLTPQQKQQIGEQMKDVLKMVGFVGILAIPGSVIFLMLINFLKLNGFLIPSSFRKEEKIEESKQVGVLYHFTSYPSFISIEKSNHLKPSTWKTIIKNKEGKNGFKQNYAVSFSRDKNFDSRAYSIGGSDVGLVIDGNKLSNRYKLTPTAEKDSPKAEAEKFEAEERIYFDNSEGIKDIKNYIINYNFYLDKIIDNIESLDSDEDLNFLRNIMLFDPKSKFFLNKKETSKQEAKKYLDEVFESELIGENKIYQLNENPFNREKSFYEILNENINEINLNSSNAVEIDGTITDGSFIIGNIKYKYEIKKIKNLYNDNGDFYNVAFYPEDVKLDIPLKNQNGKNYIKILSTMYKIILDFSQKINPDYIGISSMDNDNTKNYHIIYNNLTKNNNIPGYMKKNTNLVFNLSHGKGRFIVLKKLKTQLNENATYYNHIDYKQHIKDLTKEYKQKYPDIKIWPKVKFINGNQENAKSILTKTGHYNPNNYDIIIYTEGRHPRDIVSTFSHECYHHIQNMERRLENINGDNTFEDSHLDKIEREAYEEGNIMFRNWKDKIRDEHKNQAEKLYEDYKKYILTELFDMDLPTIIKQSPTQYVVTDNKNIEALYRFRLDEPEKDKWSVHWDFTKNNEDFSAEAWKKIVTSSYKVIKLFIEDRYPRLISISGNLNSKRKDTKNKLYKSESYLEKLKQILNNKYYIDNTNESYVLLRSHEDVHEHNINFMVKEYNEKYEDALNNFQNINMDSNSKISRWDAIKQRTKRQVLNEIYKINDIIS